MLQTPPFHNHAFCRFFLKFLVVCVCATGCLLRSFALLGGSAKNAGIENSYIFHWWDRKLVRFVGDRSFLIHNFFPLASLAAYYFRQVCTRSFSKIPNFFRSLRSRHAIIDKFYAVIFENTNFFSSSRFTIEDKFCGTPFSKMPNFFHSLRSCYAILDKFYAIIFENTNFFQLASLF